MSLVLTDRPKSLPAGVAAPALALEHDARLANLRLDGQGPMWLQIRRAIARPILDGLWTAGSRIPTELSMVKRFGAARMTVTKAVQSLANEGLVERRRKIGTVVAARAQERPVFEIWDTADIVNRSGAAYSYRLISCAFANDEPDLRDLIGVGREVSLLRVICLHNSDDQPFQLEERIVNVDAAPGITCQPLETIGPSPWLLSHVPWTQAEHAISACEADETVAEHLQVLPGSACLVVERKTWNDSVPVTVARLWHPGARHRLVGRFEPSR